MESTKEQIQETDNTEYVYYLPTIRKWMKKVSQTVWEAWKPTVNIVKHEMETLQESWNK